MAAAVRPRLLSAHGRLRVAVRAARRVHRRARRAVRALLHVAAGSGAALLLVPHGVHGRDARHGAVGQPDPARRVLGAHRPHVVHADRVLVPPPRRAARRAHGGDRDGRRRARAAARRARARRDRRQLRSRTPCSRPATRFAQHPWYPAAARADPARRFHEERAVPVPLLAAARDGRADAGVGVSALGHDGQSRRVPARAPVARARRHRACGFWLVCGAGAMLAAARHVRSRPISAT